MGQVLAMGIYTYVFPDTLSGSVTKWFFTRKLNAKTQTLQRYTYAVCRVMVCDQGYTGLYTSRRWFRAVPANDMRSIDLENYIKINSVAVAH
jgi:hypothetical protein